MSQDISVLISSSPIPSHPSTSIIEETIASIRYHLPSAPIFVMLDGLRKEQHARGLDYVEYIHRLIGYSLKQTGVKIVPFFDFQHQASMTQKTLEMVETRLMLFLEHDTPLLERSINWNMLQTSILLGETNHVRLHYDEQIHPEHEHMMRGKLTPNLMKCVQWHQRPHLSNAQWYRDMLAANFNYHSRTFIEDKMHGVVSESQWEEFKLCIYDPDGTGQNMKRSTHTNGRGDEQKYELIF